MLVNTRDLRRATRRKHRALSFQILAGAHTIAHLEALARENRRAYRATLAAIAHVERETESEIDPCWWRG